MTGTRIPADDFDARADAAPLRQEIAQLQVALVSQRTIATAIGLVAMRFGCTTEQAWRLMTRVSEHSNTKVRALARAMVNVHDGIAGPEDHDLLAGLAEHLPPGGWPGVLRREHDSQA